MSVPEDRDAAHAADHAGIDRLIDTVVPALVAKLATLNVGELEVRQDDWHVRLRRPAGGAAGGSGGGAGVSFGRRATDRAGGRPHPGHDGVGAPAAPKTASSGSSPAAIGPTNGSGGPTLSAVGPGRAPSTGADLATGAPGEGSPDRPAGPIATSPAVGVFQPGPKAAAGTRVRAGERLGVVDMLGIPHDVTAPADGLVIGVIAEAGTAVEYGQELVHIESSGAVEAR